MDDSAQKLEHKKLQSKGSRHILREKTQTLLSTPSFSGASTQELVDRLVWWEEAFNKLAMSLHFFNQVGKMQMNLGQQDAHLIMHEATPSTKMLKRS